MLRAIATCIAVPMEILGLADAVAARLDGIKAFAPSSLLTELRMAATLSWTAARSAADMARENLRDYPDRHEADQLEQQLDLHLSRVARHSDAVANFQPAGA